ncbi:MAG: SDR family oxidoreductase [Chitinophagaceae bacterium]|nr:SDR family oxidoreductase [Chitinophagaceae bacterium]
MINLIKGKVVAITGASSGIGKAIARVLANDGARVVLGARNKERLDELVQTISKEGGEAVSIVMDVCQRRGPELLVAEACRLYGRLDVIINNAGVSQLSLIEDLDVEGWEEMIDVNLKGVLYGIAAAIPVFKEQGQGHIINIVSTSGLKIVPMQGVYAGVKNAVRTITEAMRQESNGQWRVTGISPGVVQTGLATGIKNPEMRSAVQNNMDTLAIAPEDIARAVAYAISQPPEVEIGDIVIRPTAQN